MIRTLDVALLALPPVPRNRTGVARQRRDTTTSTSLGAYERPRQNNQSSYETWHNKEYGIVWEMTEDDRESALGRRELY